jgi:hypothetical protein
LIGSDSPGKKRKLASNLSFNTATVLSTLSLAHTMPATPSAETIATNTITIPNIPKEFFESPHVFEDLQNFLQVYGPLHTFVAIKGFARIMAVYEETQSAIEAKDELDKTQVLWRQTRDLTDVELVQFISDHDQQPISHSNDIHNFLLRLYFGQVSV